MLKDNVIATSMDGRGCWRDNVFVERLWESMKYEELYVRAYNTISKARQIVQILRGVDKDPAPEVVKRHGLGIQSIFGWRKRFAGRRPMMARDRRT